MKQLHTNSPDILDRRQAFKILEPHLQNIAGSINDAWNAWESFLEKAPQLRKPLSPTTRANFVYDHMVGSATRRFNGVDGVLLTKKRRYLSVVIEDRIVLRFKKLDKNHRARGIKTQQFLQFMSQQSFPGFDQTKLVGGYTVDELKAGLKEMYITCPVGTDNEWELEVFVGSLPSITTLKPDADEEKPVIRAVGIKEKKSKAQ